jgi:hypothetical protein
MLACLGGRWGEGGGDGAKDCHTHINVPQLLNVHFFHWRNFPLVIVIFVVRSALVGQPECLWGSFTTSLGRFRIHFRSLDGESHESFEI